MARKIYSILLYLLVPLVLMRLLVRSIKVPAYRKRWRERFALGLPEVPVAPIWIHAVSVGEAVASFTLVHALLKQYPAIPLWVTTTSPSGSARIVGGLGGKVHHCYAPYDLSGTMQRFFRRVKPRMVIIVETELWPNLMATAHQSNVPVILINARLSEHSLRGYTFWPTLVAPALNRYTRIATQSEIDRNRFLEAGAEPQRVQVAGNLKFDMALSSESRIRAEAIRQRLGVNSPILLAASTHKGEETYLFEAFVRLRQNHPEARLILVPRHPERAEAVVEMARKWQLDVVRRTQQNEAGWQAEVYLVDTIGELPLFYAAADVAFIGGSLVPIGGHNMLEALLWGVPVLFGPHVHNFREISQSILACQAGNLVRTVDDLTEHVDRLFRDPALRSQQGQAGLALIETNRGTLDRIMTTIDRILTQ